MSCTVDTLAVATLAVLIARACPCPCCSGSGQVRAVSCSMCAFMERISRAANLPCAATPWYFPEALEDAEAFPCGHPLSRWSVAFGYAVCPNCGGSGTVPVGKTEAAWARLDAKEARQKKQEASEAARVLAERGAACGYSRRQVRLMLRLVAPKCEAHSRRSGKPCQNRVVLGACRCRLHGGNSHGPKTAEGRARIGESNRRRSKAVAASSFE